MGGKNHQPCKNYLKNSTRMSRSFSLSIIALEQANVELEDLILAELEGEHGSVNGIVVHLNESMRHLHDTRRVIDDLQNQMRTANYSDLASLKTLDLDRMGIDLGAAHMVDSVAWLSVASLMKSEGFFGVLRFFESQINAVEHVLCLLTEKVRGLTDAASVGAVNIVLEENHAGNIRCEFARVYTLAGEFNAQFLASALISTSLWYAQMNYGTLQRIGTPIRNIVRA